MSQDGGREGLTVPAGFMPAVIDSSNEPVPHPEDSTEGKRVVEFLRRCCEPELLATDLVPASPDSGLPAGSIQFVPKESKSVPTGSQR